MKIPSVKIGDVVSILSGFAFKSEFFNDSDGVPVIRIRDVVRGYSDTYYSGAYSDQFIVEEGEIIIGMDGNFNAARWKSGPALLNQRVCKIIADSGVLDDRYLFHYLPIVLKRIEDATSFVTVKHLSASDLKNECIPLPSLIEQRRIAAILDKAVDLRLKRLDTLAELDHLAQSFFVEMFGEPITNPKDWPRVCLGELIDSGPQNGLYKPSSDYGSGAPILRIDGFYDGVVKDFVTLKRVRISEKESQTYSLNENDIVINRVNSPEYLGKSALIPSLPEPIVFESNMMRFSLNAELVIPQYVIAFLQTRYVKSQIRTASKDAVNQSSINQKDVNAFTINLPPLELQAEFSDRIKVIDKLRIAHKESLKEFDLLFSALQNFAFGENDDHTTAKHRQSDQSAYQQQGGDPVQGLCYQQAG